MTKGLRLLAFLFAFVGMISFSINNAQAASFSDVKGHWAEKEIEFLSNKNIINGYQNNGVNTFKPGDNVTRAQAAKMLVLAKGQQELKVTKASFKDVPLNHEASGWIERAVKEGYFDGPSKATAFNPQDKLTRAQMSKIIAEAFGLDASQSASKPHPFADSKSIWAKDHIKALYYAGITTGSNGKFNPNSEINRAQFSVFIARTIEDSFKVTPKPVEEAPVAPSKPAPGYIATAKATVAGVNVRSQSNSSSAILGSMKKGETVNVYSVSGFWAKVNYKGKTGYVHKTYLKLKNTSGNVLKDRLIVVDAGHGGSDPGTTGGAGNTTGINEKRIALEVSKRVEQKLKRDGAKVIMTRASDIYPSLQDRVNIATRNYAEMFVSIHVNSGPTSASGAETFFNSKNENKEASKELATEIQKQLVAMAGMKDRGVKDGNFHVIREQNTVSTLVELGFLSNASDRKKLTSSAYWDIYAEAVYRGIKSYYSK